MPFIQNMKIYRQQVFELYKLDATLSEERGED